MYQRLIDHTEQLIIVSDDHTEDQYLLSCLNKAGYKVFITPHDTEALKIFQEIKVDLVIVDLELAEANPIDFIAKIIDIRPDIPVVIVSHPGIEEITIQALTMDVTDYVKRPLTEDRLLFSIHSSLERARLKRENLEYRYKLENANKLLSEQLEEIKQDQQAGYIVQHSMLPPTPFEYNNYRFEHQINPAVYLAGDFVDYHQISNSKFVFFLLDVIGHGTASAFITVLIKQLANRSKAHFIKDKHKEIKSTAWMLGWLNKNLIEAELDRHATIFLGVLDVEKNTLNYSYGGHYPQAVYSNSKETCFLEGRGLPVGLFDNVEYEEHYLELSEQFSITLFSDGILEIMPQENLAEKEAYLLKMIEMGNNTPKSIAKDLNLNTLEHLPDDISILTLQRCAKNEPR